MSENLRQYTRALYALDAVARRVPADAWDNASCCSDWTAREVAGHASWVIRNVGAATGSMAAPEPTAEAEFAGNVPAQVVSAAVEDTLAALDQQGMLHHVAATPFGEMPIDDFLGVIWVDPLTHAWDLADATGIDHGIDPGMAAAAQAALAPLSDALRGPGRFDDPVATDATDPVDQFVAFVGRTSVR